MKEIYLEHLHQARVAHGRALARLMRSRRRGDAWCEEINHDTLRFTASSISFWSKLIKEVYGK